MPDIDLDDDDDDVPQTASLQVARCPHCSNFHIAMLDDDHMLLTEMTLDNAEMLKLAMQLMLAVYPDMNVHPLMQRIAMAEGETQERH